MKKIYLYPFLFFIPLLVDRLTKFFMWNYCVQGCTISHFISFDMILNRGVSWGMFHSSNSSIFLGVTVVIISMILLFTIYTLRCVQQGICSGAEFLVLSGAISNVIDRFLYGGVLDFILFSCGRWSFPYFNIADVVIVVGIGVMVIHSLRK